ncbi:MAG: choice-of-anchor D domain-containing protein [Gammaproteobacteria bacterium]|nr:choice-of-anchor D domain-containing protein [Gammaproteobacteria bacterium]
MNIRNIFFALFILFPAYAAGIEITDSRDIVAEDGQCSLREAVEAINNANQDVQTGIGAGECDISGGDTITLAPETYTLDGGAGPLEIRARIILEGGLNPDDTVISGAEVTKVMYVTGVGDLTLRNLTITKGKADNGAGIYIEPQGAAALKRVYVHNNNTADGGLGGGIYNEGNLSLQEVQLWSNTAIEGGGIYNAGVLNITGGSIGRNGENRAERGGGIYHSATSFFPFTSLKKMDIEGVAVSGNYAAFEGGGIYVESSTLLTLTINIANSTVSGNRTGGDGGGIFYNCVSTPLSIRNSTFSGNEAIGGGGGLYHNNSAGITIEHSTFSRNHAEIGGGIKNCCDGSVSISHTIVAGNSASNSQDVYGTFISNDYNLIGNSDGSEGFNGGGAPSNNDQTGSATVPIAPRLDPLQNNGGGTETHALQPESPAIDTGNPEVSTSEHDQRGLGYLRVQDGDGDGNAKIDIGAFELQSLQFEVYEVLDDGTREIIDDTTAVNFPSTTTGVPIKKTFVLQNSGRPLVLNSVYLSAAEDFTLLDPLANPITLFQGDTLDFMVQSDARKEGDFSDEVSIGINVAGDNPFSFLITGAVVPSEPKIEVLQQEHIVQPGETIDFGSTYSGISISKVFTVRNLGDASLIIDQFSIPDGFSVSGISEDSAVTVSPGSETSLQVVLDAEFPGSFKGPLFFYNENGEEIFYFYLSGTVQENPVVLPDEIPSEPAEEEGTNEEPPEEPEPGECADRNDKKCSDETDFAEPPAFTPDLDRHEDNEVIVDLDAGWRHTCMLTNRGRITCSGRDNYGQSAPPEELGLKGLAAGSNHNCAFRSDGRITCWGNEDSGQPPQNSAGLVQLSAGGIHSCALDSNGQIICWGYNFYGQTNPPQQADFTAISAGGFHSCALKRNNRAVCWGRDNYGQSSAPEDLEFTQISAGEYHTCALQTNGRIRCWGDNYSGQSDPPDYFDFTQISSGEEHSCGLRRNNRAICWGLNDDGQAKPPSSEAGFILISAGGYHTCALTKNARTVCWGRKP